MLALIPAVLPAQSVRAGADFMRRTVEQGRAHAQAPKTRLPVPDAEQASHPLLFWRAQRGATTVYLLAAIHLAGPEIYPLDPAITDAFDKSSALIVEVDIQSISPAVLRKLMARYAYYPDGDSLDRHLSADLMKQVLAAAERAHLPAASVNRMRPWLVESVLSSLDTGDLHLQTTWGVDNHFLTLAHTRKMRIISLETAAEQLSIISSLADKLQVRSLKETLGGVQEDSTSLASLYDAWKSGDVERLAKEVDTPFRADAEMGQVYQQLFANRNRNWAARVDRLAAPAAAGTSAAGSYFLVVGAGHLVGPDNLRDLLVKRGWRVERVEPVTNLMRQSQDAQARSPATHPAR